MDIEAGPTGGSVDRAAAGRPPSTGSSALHPLGPIFGRDADLARIAALRRDGGRLVTLTGPGGVGKTRLALAVAAAEDGDTVVVSLAPVDRADLVVPAVARAMGVGRTGARPLQRAVADLLRRRDVLLVLDNFEHLLPAAADIARLLADVPRVRVLVTSRAPLRIRGEQQYPVAPLAVPEATEVDEIARAPAVQLFSVRARAVVPDFTLTAANARAVSAVCRRLDGVPLALELAAAQLRLLTPADLLARLDAALPILVDGTRDGPGRHRTMHDTIAWSHGLLGPAATVLFRRLSVFAGDWSLDAAEAICADGQLATADVLPALRELVEHTLVIADLRDPATARYRLLEPVRQFASAEAARHAEAHGVADRHARHYQSVALPAADESAVERRTRLGRLARERDNLRVALQRLAETADATAVAELAAAAWPMWWRQGDFAEGRRWLADALDIAGDTAPPTVRAELLHGAGWLARHQGVLEDAAALLRASVPLYRAHGDRRNESHALHRLAAVTLDLGSLDDADALIADSLSAAHASRDPWAIGAARYWRGHIALARGDHPAAADDLAAALRAFRDTGDDWATGRALGFLGVAITERGDLAAGEELLAQAVEATTRTGDRWGRAWWRLAHGRLLHARADLDAAARELGVAVRAFLVLGDDHRLALALEAMSALASARGRPRRAAALLGSSVALLRRMGSELPPAWRPQHAATEQELRARLGTTHLTAIVDAAHARTEEDMGAEALREANEAGRAPAPAGLTPREVDVLVLLAEGMTDAQIAERLHLSVRTVGGHLQSAYRKLAVSSRSAAVRRAIDLGLTT